MQKNTASQKWRVFAFDKTTNTPKTGDAANITAKISKDYGTATATNDTNPAEIEDGYYEFDLTQAETNASDLLILPESSTANIVVLGCPATIATTPAGWSDDVIQTGDAYARIGTNGVLLTQVALSSTSTGAVADAVWDELYSQHTTSGTFGKLIDTIRKANLTIDGVVSNAITPTALTFASDVVANTSAYAHAVLLFVSGPLAGENSPILSYTSTDGVIVLEEALTAIPSPGDEFIIAASQHVHAIQDIADAIELTVLPLQATVVDRVAGTTINLFTGETASVTVAVTDEDGVAVDLTSLTLELILELRPSTDVVVVDDASITHSNGSFAFTVPAAVTNAARACKWALRKTNDDSVLVQGDLFVNYAPTAD